MCAACVAFLESAINVNTSLASHWPSRRTRPNLPNRPAKAWILFQDSTIHRHVEYNNTRKVLPRLAVQRYNMCIGQFMEFSHARIQPQVLHAEVDELAAKQALQIV